MAALSDWKVATAAVTVMEPKFKREAAVVTTGPAGKLAGFSAPSLSPSAKRNAGETQPVPFARSQSWTAKTRFGSPLVMSLGGIQTIEFCVILPVYRILSTLQGPQDGRQHRVNLRTITPAISACE